MPEVLNPATESPEHKVRLILSWLATNRDAEALDTEALLQQLAHTAQAQLPPPQLFKMIELLYACLERNMRERIKAFTLMEIPLPRSGRQAIQQIQQALEAFAQAYERCLPTLSNSTSKTEKYLCLNRAASCLQQHLFISHLVAAPPAIGIWQRLHTLFREGLHLPQENGQPQQPPAYNLALLLACAQPASYSAHELKFVADYIQHHSHHLDILATQPEEVSGVFWIDPSRDFPAFALGRRAPPADAQVFYFSCRPLSILAKTHLQSLMEGQSPETLGLPSFAGSVAGKGTLRRLAAYWGSPGKRRFPRRRQSYRATLCVGLKRLWRMLQTPEESKEEDFSEWMITNESPDGYSLMHLHGKMTRTRVGDVVALRPEAEPGGSERWLICLVRWVISENPEHVEIGLQVLAPSATPARLAIPGDPNHQEQSWALILPELPPLRNEPVLLAPAGVVNDPKRQLVLLIEKENLEIRQVNAREVNEQTGRIEVFTIVPDAS